MSNFKITKTILENINEQNERINECVDIVNGYTTDEETRVNQEIQRQQNELRREEQYNNNENKFNEINTQLEKNMNYVLDMENSKPIEIESIRVEDISDDDLLDLAIQQVINGNRKCIKLSARTYNIRRSHTIENLANKTLIKGISIIGEGYGTVINCMNDISEGVFNFKIPSNQQNVVISNIRFEFNGFDVLGVNFNEGGQLFRAENLIFLNNSDRNGIGLKTGFNTTINNVVLEKICCHNLKIGLEVSCDASIIDKCIIRSCDNGIIGGKTFMNSASSVNILNTEIAQCNNSIYYSGKTTVYPLVININNCRIESSNGYDIYLEGYDNNNYRCRNINIQGCYITNVNKTSLGIALHRTLGCTIIGNLFKDFDTPPVTITTMQECWGMANTTIGGDTVGVFSSGISLINLLQNSFTNGVDFGTEFRSFVKVGNLTTLPSPSSMYRGRIITVNATSDDEDDKIYICKKIAGQSYKWVEL